MMNALARVLFAASLFVAACVTGAADTTLRAERVVVGSAAFDTSSFVSSRVVTTHAWYSFIANDHIEYSGAEPLYGHASFNDNVTITGVVTSDHHHSFQSYPHYGANAEIGELTSFFSQIDVSAGMVDNAYGMLVSNPLGAGYIGTLFGLRVAPMTRGTQNWGAYFDGPNRIFVGGDVWLGNASGPQASVGYEPNSGHLALRARPGYGIRAVGPLMLERIERAGLPSASATPGGMLVVVGIGPVYSDGWYWRRMSNDMPI